MPPAWSAAVCARRPIPPPPTPDLRRRRAAPRPARDPVERPGEGLLEVCAQRRWTPGSL